MLGAGVIGFFAGFYLISDGANPEFSWESTNWVEAGYGIALLVLGIVAIVGSSYAIARKNFGLALAGGICAILNVTILGIPALILIALSKSEFSSSKSP